MPFFAHTYSMSAPIHIRDHNHNSIVTRCFFEYYQKGFFTDCVVMCRNEVEFRVHRIVLAAGSVYFEKSFANLKGADPFLIMHDMKPEIFQLILTFLYSGDVQVSSVAAFKELRSAADSLKIRSLLMSMDNASMNSRFLSQSPRMAANWKWLQEHPEALQNLTKGESSKKKLKTSRQQMETNSPQANPIFLNQILATILGQSSDNDFKKLQNTRSNEAVPGPIRQEKSIISVKQEDEGENWTFQQLMMTSKNQIQVKHENEPSESPPQKKVCNFNSKVLLGRRLQAMTGPSVVPPLSNTSNADDDKKQSSDDEDCNSEDNNSTSEDTDTSMNKFSRGSISPNSDKENIGTHSEGLANELFKREKPENLTVSMNPLEMDFLSPDDVTQFLHGYRTEPGNPCKHCPESFATANALAKHIQHQHPLTLHYCDTCNKSYAWKSGLYKHKRSHHGLEKKESCGKVAEM